MSRVWNVLFFGAVLGTSPVQAQLHLITGSAGPKSPTGYSSSLFRIATDRTVEKVEDLVTDRGGTEWIAASQELRKAVLVPREPNQPVVVVGFDRADAVKKCALPDPNIAPVEQWLWNTPTSGPVYTQFRAVGNQARLVGMILDPSVSCDKSFISPTPSEAKYLAASGSAGVAEAGGFDHMRVLIKKDGALTRYFPFGLGEAYFDERVPTGLFSDFQHPIAFVIASNTQLLAIAIIEDGNPSKGHALLVFRRSDQNWRRIPELAPGASYEHVFGAFVAGAGVIRKEATKEESAGRSEWRSQESRTGPSTLALFQESPFAFPGRLYLYDASSEQTYTIVTNQADSEILLVENGTVYYRASDRLYAASLSGSRIGPGRLLATSEAVRDAHWAFIKH
jgi:hypothetical protein